MFDSQAFLLHLTNKPGVYRMINAEGEVLYVGKASNLKKRVASYFSSQVKTYKTASLVSQIANIDVTVTASEVDALLLESNLIKQWRPKYNVLLRDDKTYPYIYISDHPFPRIDMVRTKKKPVSGDFFGPYPNTTAVKDTLNFIQKVFKVRPCTDTFFSARTRPCLQYQIHRCTAPCVGFIDISAYQERMNDTKEFLRGHSNELLQALIARMDEASITLAFEKAAVIRDQIKALRSIQEQQSVTKQKGDLDVIAIDASFGDACVCLLRIRGGEVLHHETFFPTLPKDIEQENLWEEVWLAFIRMYYIDFPEHIPYEIIIDDDVSDKILVEQTLTQLSGRKVNIITHPRLEKKQWMQLAKDNLIQSIEQKSLSKKMLERRFADLISVLELSDPIDFMECYDISHTGGEASIASCVVFDKHGPNKRMYRQFNITNITPGDDYAAMEQVLLRRFSKIKSNDLRPSLLIIDGGKGQVGVAKRVLETLGITDVPILGIAKGPGRKAGLEQFIWGEKTFGLPEDSPATLLLQHIRNEAHRFAITRHRKKRDKIRQTSQLDAIEGVGLKRRQALLKQFGGIQELLKASIHEIAKVNGISDALAERIHLFLHG